MGEHHQLGGKTERNASKERTGLEQFVVGAANIVHNMVEALRRLVTAQGGGVGQCAQEEKVVYH